MRLIAALSVMLMLAACSQGTPPFQRFAPEGLWSGTWSGAGLADTNLTATITATSSGWQALFNSNNTTVTAICTNPDDQGPTYLYCGAWSSAEVLVWEGDVRGGTWSGIWTYVSSGGNRGGGFTLFRTP